jgi:hypothetical protein
VTKLTQKMFDLDSETMILSLAWDLYNITFTFLSEVSYSFNLLQTVPNNTYCMSVFTQKYLCPLHMTGGVGDISS